MCRTLGISNPRRACAYHAATQYVFTASSLLHALG